MSGIDAWWSLRRSALPRTGYGPCRRSARYLHHDCRRVPLVRHGRTPKTPDTRIAVHRRRRRNNGGLPSPRSPASSRTERDDSRSPWTLLTAGAGRSTAASSLRRTSPFPASSAARRPHRQGHARGLRSDCDGASRDGGAHRKHLDHSPQRCSRANRPGEPHGTPSRRPSPWRCLIKRAR
jgi:hypothetical protein